MQTLLMVNPDGESGEVLLSNMAKALKQGYERGVRIQAPNNTVQVVAMSQVALYLSAGFKIIPE
jgi:hypothetical protein